MRGAFGSVPHGVMFHHFHGGRHPTTQGSISAEELDDLIRFIGPQRFLDPLQWVEKADHGGLMARDFCLTFDDGLLSQVDVALPVLAAHGLRGFWFVYSSVFEGHTAKFEIYRRFRENAFDTIDEFYEQFFAKVNETPARDRARRVSSDAEVARRKDVIHFYSTNDARFRLIRDRALTTDEYELIMDSLIVEFGFTPEELSRDLWMSDSHLRSLSDAGHLVGLHSYSHPMLIGSLPYDQQRHEYRKNFDHLERVCGRAPVAMGHPADSYNDDTLRVLEELGIRCGFRSNLSRKTAGATLNPTRFEMAREDHTQTRR